MSGIVKALKKGFISPISAIIGGKTGKVIRKIATGALMVGAVVMTGGAALGVLPSMGAMVGSLGLGATLTSALSGAISTGAVGAVTGLLGGGLKGAEKGFWMGAATGGVLGGIGVLGPNGLLGGGKAAAAGSKALSAGPGISSSITNASLPATTTVPALGLPAPGGIGVPSFASAALPAASTNVAQAASILPSVPSLAPAAAKGGIGGFLSNNPMMTMMAGQAISGLATPSEASSAAKAQEKEGANLFSGTYTGNGFGTPGGYAIPDRLKASQPSKRFRLNRQTMEVEEMPG